MTITDGNMNTVLKVTSKHVIICHLPKTAEPSQSWNRQA